jgi:CheY-like chemotaxis protein
LSTYSAADGTTAPAPLRYVLLVEDDRDIRELLADLLRDEGYVVVEAANGAVALEALRADPSPRIDVILLDLMMPVMDGVEFRSVQLADPRFALIPVILFTADAKPEHKAELLSAADVIPKPIRIEELVSRIAKVCTARG